MALLPAFGPGPTSTFVSTTDPPVTAPKKRTFTALFGPLGTMPRTSPEWSTASAETLTALPLAPPLARSETSLSRIAWPWASKVMTSPVAPAPNLKLKSCRTPAMSLARR